ncbi:MAG: tetratricopeptide repeat protein [Alphaproteobacteria bacterium]|nr:tetratricopeptide repeat protein [Alphaproteobacteria bacterium]
MVRTPVQGNGQNSGPPPILKRAVEAHQMGQYQAASKLFRTSLKREGESPVALFRYGLLKFEQQQYPEAARLFRRAAQREPNSGPLFHYLGICLAAMEKNDEAISAYESALRIAPNQAETHNNLGHVLQWSGRLEEAQASYKSALAIKPDYFEALNNLANTLNLLGKPAEAVPLFEEALIRQPRFAEAMVNYGNVLIQLGRFDEAIVQYNKALQIAPSDRDALECLARTLQLMERGDQAVPLWEKLVSLFPGHEASLIGLGTTLRELGRLDEAVTAFEKAVEVSPKNVSGYYNLGLSRSFKRDERLFAALLKLERGFPGSNPLEEVEYRFTTGRAFAGIKDYDRSFQEYDAANRLRRSQLNYDEAEILERFTRIQSVFNDEFMSSRGQLGSPSERPVFILGMPRSGTTLAEQILSSHPAVFGAGELTGMGNAISYIAQKVDEGRFPEDTALLEDKEFAQLGSDYLSVLEKFSPANAERVIDKMPNNFLTAGLIHLMLPNARIVHMRRDLRDVAVSNYTTMFNTGMEHTYDLAELGRYLRSYSHHMDHWRQVLPQNAMLEIRYEDLITDLETHARSLVAYCGLPWDDACLNFHETERSVRTASVTQVRQPIYTSSAGRWRVYEQHLGPLLDQLEGIIPSEA